MNKVRLTKEQEKCVEYEGGDLLVKGVAGSGKSYVILSRAVKAHKKYPSAKIGIFTFQKTLVTYTKSLLKLQLNEDDIEVRTVDSYCKDIYTKLAKAHPNFENLNEDLIRKSIDKHEKNTNLEHRLYHKDLSFWIDEFNWIRGKYIKSIKEYESAERVGRGSQVRVTKADRHLIWEVYTILLQEMRKMRQTDWNEIYIYLNDHIKDIPDEKRFDYVFIDEAQDMTLAKMKVLRYLTKKTLTIAADAAQKIHKSSFTWKEVGIDITGSGSKSLSKSFRSTKQIILLAEDLMKENRKSMYNYDYTDAVLPDVEGLLPKLCVCKNAYAQNGYIKALLSEINLDNNRVAIIGHTKKEIETLKKTLYTLKIKYEYVDTDKSDWDILKPGVKIVKAFSSKGLEFDYVIIPYLTDYIYPYKPDLVEKEALEEFLLQQRSILYVAMTRARTGLIMMTIKGKESRFIDCFDKAHYEVEEV